MFPVILKNLSTQCSNKVEYGSFPKYLDRLAKANSVELDQILQNVAFNLTVKVLEVW